jgi:hypothetical protein
MSVYEKIYSLLDTTLSQTKMSCSICLNINNKATFALGCGHKFHKKCIYAWFDFNSSCPYCRYVDQTFVEAKTLMFAKALMATMFQVLSDARTDVWVDAQVWSTKYARHTDINYTKYTLYYKSPITKAIKNGDLQYLWDMFSKLYNHGQSYKYIQLYHVTISKLSEGNDKHKWSVNL